MRTAAWHTAPQIALRDYFKKLVGGRSIYKVLVKVESNNIQSEKEVLIFQSCPTLSDPMDCRPSGSSVHGISQARILEWVAISFSNASSWPLSAHFTKRFLLRRSKMSVNTRSHFWWKYIERRVKSDPHSYLNTSCLNIHIIFH